MSDVEKLKKILIEDYGIKNEQELNDAIRKMDRLDIGIFVTPREEITVLEQKGA